MPIGGAVGQNKFETHALVRSLARGLGRELSVPIEVLPLADGEINLDRVDGGDRGHGPAVWIDQGAYLKLSLPGDAVDGCNEAAKKHLYICRFNGPPAWLYFTPGPLPPLLLPPLFS